MYMKKLGIFTPNDLTVQIDVTQIVTLHYFKYAKNFTFSGEKHNFWEIAYVDRGEVGVVAENQGFDLSQGEAIFHKPNEYHNIWAKNQYANVVILSFVCTSPAMAQFENRIIRFGDEHRAILGKILKEGELCFQDPLNDVHQTKLNLAQEPPYGSLQVIKNYTEILLLRLLQEQTAVLRQNRASEEAKSQGDGQVAEAVCKILEDNLYNELTLSDVLQKVCFSKSYITRLFRQRTGYSIMGFALKLKIDEAQRLISERNLRFTEIAECLHFSSVHHFSSSFKKHTGMTPTEYRRSVQSMQVL